MCDLLIVRCSNIFCALRHSWRARCKNIFAQSIHTLSTAEYLPCWRGGGGGGIACIVVFGKFAVPLVVQDAPSTVIDIEGGNSWAWAQHSTLSPKKTRLPALPPPPWALRRPLLLAINISRSYKDMAPDSDTQHPTFAAPPPRTQIESHGDFARTFHLVPMHEWYDACEISSTPAIHMDMSVAVTRS